jgi:hypothetical protein
MPWYRIHANHGPGHQSSTEHYHYSKTPINKVLQESMWHDYFDNYDWPIGDCELVTSLPEHILASKIGCAKDTIKSQTAMLKVLRDTPSKPVIAVRIFFPNSFAGSKTPAPRFEARLWSNAAVTRVAPTRDKAVRRLLRTLKAKKKDYEVITR